MTDKEKYNQLLESLKNKIVIVYAPEWNVEFYAKRLEYLKWLARITIEN